MWGARTAYSVWGLQRVEGEDEAIAEQALRLRAVCARIVLLDAGHARLLRLLPRPEGWRDERVSSKGRNQWVQREAAQRGRDAQPVRRFGLEEALLLRDALGLFAVVCV